MNPLLSLIVAIFFLLANYSTATALHDTHYEINQDINRNPSLVRPPSLTASSNWTSPTPLPSPSSSDLPLIDRDPKSGSSDIKDQSTLSLPKKVGISIAAGTVLLFAVFLGLYLLGRHRRKQKGQECAEQGIIQYWPDDDIGFGYDELDRTGVGASIMHGMSRETDNVVNLQEGRVELEAGTAGIEEQSGGPMKEKPELPAVGMSVVVELGSDEIRTDVRFADAEGELEERNMWSLTKRLKSPLR